MMPKVCILAGGLGTRLSEETVVKPKPMVEIGGHPVLWHIMKLYSTHGFNDFVVALGYKGEYIKDYFVQYATRASDLSVDLATGAVKASNSRAEPWRVDLVETGLETHTGGRVKRLCEHVGDGIFMMTYGDGVADVDLTKLLAFHRSHGKLATVTAVIPPARFGALSFQGDCVECFQEKPIGGDGWINGGFFVLDARVVKYIDCDDVPFEQDPLRRLARDGQLMGYKHSGFWHCMDTLRDVRTLNDMWMNGAAPWDVWSKIVPDEQGTTNETSILAQP
jgi:glucose-1-phosphate cytidylyltransferase